jgi:hypothetical protein
MKLEIADVRPAFLPTEAVDRVRELKGCRHVFRHAYDVKLDVEKLRALSAASEEVAAWFPDWVEAFCIEAIQSLQDAESRDGGTA